jgi:hypothetical protein
MRFREATQRLGRSRAGLSAACVLLATGLGACGEDDFENQPRPPSPIELTAAIDKRGVSIAPSDPGAGLVVITVSNQTDDDAQLILDGPGDDDPSSGTIEPLGTGSIKAELEEGTYEATTGIDSIEAAEVTVGPPRESSQNDLLLP